MYNAWNGETNRPTITAGTAPINGPTYGIILVIPQNTANNKLYGCLKMVIAIKLMIPMITASTIVLLIYADNVSFSSLTV